MDLILRRKRDGGGTKVLRRTKIDKHGPTFIQSHAPISRTRELLRPTSRSRNTMKAVPKTTTRSQRKEMENVYS